MHYLDATPPRSPIRPFCRFLGGAHFRRGRGAEDVVGRPDGRTLASLSGPQGATPPPLSHSLTGGRLLLQIASATAIRAQPSVRVCSLVTLARVARVATCRLLSS